MAKILKVTKPFSILEVGDTLELSDNGKTYVAKKEETFDNGCVDGELFSALFNSSLSLSKAYVDTLIESGLLEEVYDKKQDFVNVFDEINRLIVRYTKEYKEADENANNLPAVVRLERMTVLNNMINVLNHLNNLKK